jgi:hypothetical protein
VVFAGIGVPIGVSGASGPSGGRDLVIGASGLSRAALVSLVSAGLSAA